MGISACITSTTDISGGGGGGAFFSAHEAIAKMISSNKPIFKTEFVKSFMYFGVVVYSINFGVQISIKKLSFIKN